MPLEICIRPRCGKCGIAIELQFVIRKLSFPVKPDLPPLVELPTGWAQEGDELFCSNHAPRRIVEATSLPAPGPTRRVH
jgi:hypothetical protein